MDSEEELEQTLEHPIAAAEAVIDDAIDTLEAAPGDVADAAAAALKALELRVDTLEKRVESAITDPIDDSDEGEEGEGVPVVVPEEPEPNIARVNDSFVRKIHNVLG